MKFKPFTYCILFLLLLNSIDSIAFELGDTIRLKPTKKAEEKKKDKIIKQPFILKTNPLAILWGPIPYTAEYRIVAEITTGRTQSEQFGISYIDKSVIYGILEKVVGVPAIEQYKVKGWRIQYAHRFYLISRKRYAPYGFFVSPALSYSDARISVSLDRYYRENYFDFRHINAAILIGVQVGRTSRFSMEVFGGIGIKKNIVQFHANMAQVSDYDTKDFGTIYNSPLKITLGMNMGWSFK